MSLVKHPVRLIVLIAILAIPLFIIWSLFFPHKSQTSGPVSLRDADGCPIPLPPEARNIQYYKYSHWIEFREFVRFEASAEVCKSHVAKVVAKWRESHGDYVAPGPLEPISDSVDSYKTAPAWFDVSSIKSGFHANGNSSTPTFWIDTDRGVFYYKMTD